MKAEAVAVLLVVLVSASAGAGYLVGSGNRLTATSYVTSAATSSVISTASVSKSSTAWKDIGNVDAISTPRVNGTNVEGTVFLGYPSSAQSGDINAPIVSVPFTIDCNDSFFVVNSDNRVIVSLVIDGNGNSVSMDGLRLNLTINGNMNMVDISPQPVMMYGEHISGIGNKLSTAPLPP